MNEWHWFLGWMFAALTLTVGIVRGYWWCILLAVAFGAVWWLVGNFPADQDPPEDIR